MTGREQYILDACRGRRVLHLGCCDTPFCASAAVGGQLLHLKLRDVAGELWGLDLAEADIAYLRQSHNLDNLVVGDAQHLDRHFENGRFSVVVAAEIVEHLPNPGMCLQAIRKILSGDGTLLVTVPNGVAFRRGLKSLSGHETVHPDHNFYFSRKTVAHLVETSGFRITDIRGYRMSERHFAGAYITDRLAGFFSQWACEGIMLKAIPAEDGISR